MQLGRMFINVPWRLFLSLSSVRSCLYASVVLLACSFFFPSAYAQQDVGYIIGTVSDAQGGVLPSAKVKVTNSATGITQDLTTNSTGFYQTQALPPGRYTVTVSLEGFSTSITPDVILDVAARQAVNVTLQVGSVSSNITVSAHAPSLNTVDPQISTTVNTRAVQELPVSGRSALALATLTPGVSTATGATSQGFGNRGTAVSAIRIAGGVPGSNNSLLDGASNLQSYLGEVAINVKTDAVEEFRIMSGVIPAQFGYTSGGVINVVTLSGGNQLHGSLYEFLRNDALDATRPLPKSSFGKPELRFNNYGGTLGGPIIHNKAFYFGNYEEYRYVTASFESVTVPTLKQRKGDFSDLMHLSNGACVPTNIYDPSTATTTGQRTQFPGNVIPSNQLNPIALKVQELLYPEPNNTAGSYNSCTNANNYIANPKTISNERQGVARVDYLLGEKDAAFARFAYYYNYNNNAGGYNSSNTYFDRNDYLQNYLGVLSETHSFSSSLTNDFRIAFVRSDFPFRSSTAGSHFAEKVGIPSYYPTVAPIFSNGLKTINGTDGFRASTTYEVLDDMTKSIGTNVLRFGMSGRFTEGFNNQTSSSAGTYNFGASQTAKGNNTTVTVGTGSAYASFLIGAVSSGYAQESGGVAYRKFQYAGYFQDDWTVNRRLTLNLGLRYDYQAQPHEKKNGIETFDITRVNPITGYMGAVRYAGVNGEGSNFAKENWGNWGPRVGFALLLTQDSKTVLRGGAAIYYATTATASYDASAGNQAGFGRTDTNYSSSSSSGPAFQLSGGLPYAPTKPLGSAGGPNAFLGQTGYYVRPNAKDPDPAIYFNSIP